MSQIPVNEDTYVDEKSGLRFCKRCGTPRQCRVTVLGVVLTPGILCRCQQEKEAARAHQMEQESFRQKVKRLKLDGLQDPCLAQDTLSKAKKDSPHLLLAKRYVQHFSQLSKQGTGLLLWGGVGTGKTFLAACIANALLEQGIPVLMTSFPRVLNGLSGMWKEDKNQYVDSLNQYPLLILDDLGVERTTDFGLEQIYLVVDGRCRSQKPLIVTTNLTLWEMKHPEDVKHQRIYERILEHCVPVCFQGTNFRPERAAERMKEMQKWMDIP